MLYSIFWDSSRGVLYIYVEIVEAHVLFISVTERRPIVAKLGIAWIMHAGLDGHASLKYKYF